MEKRVTTGSATGAKIRIEADGSYHEEEESGASRKLEKASITLADCLACSGCVTSAETVLVEAQSDPPKLENHPPFHRRDLIIIIVDCSYSMTPSPLFTW